MGKLIIHNPNLLSPTIFLNEIKIGKALNRNNTYNIPTGYYTLKLKTFLLKSTPCTIHVDNNSISEFSVEERAHRIPKLPTLIKRVPSKYLGLILYALYLILGMIIDIFLPNDFQTKYIIKSCFLLSIFGFYIINKRTNCYINLTKI